MTVRVITGDALEVLRTLPEASIHCVVTSPPYWGLRDYGHAGQLGLEPTLPEYIANMTAVFREVRRVLRPDGTCWVNMGDSYASSRCGGGDGALLGARKGVGAAAKAKRTYRRDRAVVGHISHRGAPIGLKSKDLCGVPWRLAFALQDDGWYLRQDIVWHKKNPMPESVQDRLTKAHEYVFLLAKSKRYYFNQAAIAEPCSPDTHERMARGRADGEVAKPVAGWAYNGGDHSAVAHATEKLDGDPRKMRRERKSNGVGFGHGFDADPKPRVKNNASFDAGMAVMPAMRNKRSVWSMATEAFKGAHFATFPTELASNCILAGCPPHGTVLDPFGGAGTTGLVADRLQRNAILIEIKPEYAAMSRRRVFDEAPLLQETAA